MRLLGLMSRVRYTCDEEEAFEVMFWGLGSVKWEDCWSSYLDEICLYSLLFKILYKNLLCFFYLISDCGVVVFDPAETLSCPCSSL